MSAPQSTSDNSFNFMSWNVGSDDDYFKKSRIMGVPGFENLSPKQENEKLREIKEPRNEKIRAIFKEASPEIVSLQEVGRGEEDLQRLKDWLGSEYEVHIDEKGDSAIAWKTRRFKFDSKMKENLDSRQSVVDLKDIQTGKVIRVASAHISGTLFHEPEMDPSTTYGDEEIEKLSEAVILKTHRKGFLRRKQEPDGVLVGADLNTGSNYEKRQEFLTEKGFSVDSVKDMTNYPMGSDVEIGETGRKIDYVFSKAKKLQKLYVETSIAKLRNIKGWKENPSDHHPLISRVSFDRPPQGAEAITPPSAEAKTRPTLQRRDRVRRHLRSEQAQPSKLPETEIEGEK